VIPSGDVVTLDRSSGERLATVPTSTLRALSGANETAHFAVSAIIAGDVLVAAAFALDQAQDLEAFGFDARSGTLLWRTVLGHMPNDLGEHNRWPTPALAHGDGLVFVVPGWGVVIALDPEQGGVAWLRRYTSLRERSPRVPLARGRRLQVAEAIQSPAFRPSFVALARGALLVAASDANEVRALDPLSGDPIWTTADGGSRVLAAYGGGVIEVDAGGTVSVIGKGGEEHKAQIHRVGVLGAALSGDVLFIPNERGTLYRIDLSRSRSPPAETGVTIPFECANVTAGFGHIVAAGESKVFLLGERTTDASLGALDVASLTSALGDLRPRVRDAASAVLAGLGDEPKDALREAAQSADAERAVRAHALLAVIERRERRGRFLEPLRRSGFLPIDEWADDLVSLDPSARSRRLDPLRRTPHPNYLPIFEELCRDPDPDVRRKASVADYLSGGRAGPAAIERLALSKNTGDRQAAMEALQRQGSAGDFALFEKGLVDEDKDVKTTAFMGAVERGDGRLVRALIQALDSGTLDKGHLLQWFDNKDPPTLPMGPLLGHLVQDDDPGIRQTAARVLRKSNNGDARLALSQALLDQVPNVRAEAARSLSELIEKAERPDLPPGAIDHLIRECVARKLPPPMKAARRLLDHGGVVRPASFARVAAEALRDSLRAEALDALRASVELAPVDSADLAAIVTLTRSDLAPVRGKAYDALLRARGPDRAAVLVRVLDEVDAEVRASVLSELASCDADLAAELIPLEVADRRVTALVRALPARTLALASLRGLDSPDERVRARSLENLRRMRDELAKLAKGETDATIRAKLEEARARSGP